MHKLSYLGITILILLVLTGCQGYSPTSLSIREAGWGNSANNIIEGGYVVVSDNSVFFTDVNSDTDYLHKHDITTGQLIELTSKTAYNLNAVEDKIFFLNGLPGSIFEIKQDGTGLKKLIDKPCSNLLVSADHMLFLSKSDLIISDGTGKGERKLASNVRRFLLFQDKIIFIQSKGEDGGLYSISPDGTNLKLLSAEAPISIGTNGTNLIYSVSNDMKGFGKKGGCLYTIDAAGEVSQLELYDECWNLNVTNEYIFYRNQTQGGALYRADINGGNPVCLIKENCSNINIFNACILFRVITSSDIEAGYYLLDFDGENLRLFDNPGEQHG